MKQRCDLNERLISDLKSGGGNIFPGTLISPGNDTYIVTKLFRGGGGGARDTLITTVS